MASGSQLTETDQVQMAFQSLPSAERLPKFSSSGILFKNAAEIEIYRAPVTSEDFSGCIVKIHDALVGVDTVWDIGSHPNDYKKFLPGGDWSDSKDLQAMAVYVYYVLRKVQSDGTTGPALRLSGPSRNPTRPDVDFTFAQHLYWTTFLLRHYKSYANRFMCQLGVEAYVARIWTVLLLDKSFQAWWWQSLNAKQREDCRFDIHMQM
jgi:hypothetical protein